MPVQLRFKSTCPYNGLSGPVLVKCPICRLFIHVNHFRFGDIHVSQSQAKSATRWTPWDRSLAGLDQGDLITIPSLSDDSDWERMEMARKAPSANPFLDSIRLLATDWIGIRGCRVDRMLRGRATDKSLSFCKNDSFLRAVASAVSYPLN